VSSLQGLTHFTLNSACIGIKVATPNFDPFLKPCTQDSCLKCTPTSLKCTSTMCLSLWSVLESPISSTFKIYSLFMPWPKNAF